MNNFYNYFFRLHSSCIPVKGHTRAVICDLQRGYFDFIPNDLYFVLQDLEKNKIESLILQQEQTDQAIIREYIDFLLKKEYGFLCEEKELSWFPGLNTEWRYPGIIQNCIVDSNSDSHHDWPEIFSQLSHLGCSDVQLRFYCETAPGQLSYIISALSGSMIQNVDILIKFSHNYATPGAYAHLIDEEPRINNLFIHSAKEDKLDYTPRGKIILFSKERILDHSHCGKIAPAYFSVNNNFYTESLSFNTCLNKKISIDHDGNIKNCPSMTRSFGNIKHNKLAAIANEASFTSVWGITKDIIDTCKDCEFRRICSDCRAYTMDPIDPQSKPLKCGYDPYSGAWKEWSKNPLSKSAIERYRIS